jgi:hypothetical protein
MHELRQRLEKRAVEIMRTRAKDACRDLLAGQINFIILNFVAYAACMKIENYSGPFKCRDLLQNLNGCLREKYIYRSSYN